MLFSQANIKFNGTIYILWLFQACMNHDLIRLTTISSSYCNWLLDGSGYCSELQWLHNYDRVPEK